jgi:peroxiredoxin
MPSRSMTHAACIPSCPTPVALRRWSVLLLACACAWIAAGCTARPARAHAALSVAAPESRASELQLNTPVPDVPFTLQDGFQLRLPAMKGKIIAVFFCTNYDDPQCRREAEVLSERHVELHDEHHVVIIGVSPGTTAAHKAFLSAHHMPLDFASDPDGRVARAFGITGAPDELRMIVIDTGGTIRAVWRGTDPDRHVRDLLLAARN